MDNTIRRSPINGMPIPSAGAPRPQPVARPVIKPTTAGTPSPVAKPVASSAKPAPKPVETPMSRPAVTHTTQATAPKAQPTVIKDSPKEAPNATPKTTPKPEAKPSKPSSKKSGNSKLWLYVVAGVAVCAIIGVIIAIVMNLPKGGDNSGDDTSLNLPPEENTEEQKRITEETVSKYAEVTVDGYREIEDGSMEGKAVIVKVRNKSEETVSIAVIIGAYDSSDTLLETSSVYAESVQPDQTHTFNSFVFSQLSPEQLQSAKYKVYRAYTYNVSGETIEDTSAENTPAEGTIDVPVAPETTNEEPTPAEADSEIHKEEPEN